MTLGLAALWATRAAANPVHPPPIQVGPSRAIKTIAEAARRARDGDRIEIDAGDYYGDVAVWLQNDLTIVSAGGRARLRADGASAEGKAIWVVRGQRVLIEGFDFTGAAVPSRNGAGLRFDVGSLTVRDCSFMHNEMGLMTGNEARTVLEVESCEFAYNLRPDGHNHNLYAGRIARLSVTGSYFHHAQTGHLFKSRAAVSDVLYNRLVDGAGGRASYELEFPEGGIATVIGNVIAQNAQTENLVLVSFGAEGYRWPANELYLASNTLIDRPNPPGTFLHVWPGVGKVQVVNNLFVGNGDVRAGGMLLEPQNVVLTHAAFARYSDAQFRLKADAPIRGRWSTPGSTGARAWAPDREYVHPRGTVALAGSAHNPGAMQSVAPEPR
ncbi:MAG: hypothetical protein ABI589_06915 [Burkholderiales bacterium]